MIRKIDDWQNVKYHILFIYYDEDIMTPLTMIYPNITYSRGKVGLFESDVELVKYDFVYTGLKNYEPIIDVLQYKIPIVCHSGLIHSESKTDYEQKYPGVLFLEKPCDIHSYRFIKMINQYLKAFKKRRLRVI
jgi:hypothetical protein